MPKGQAFLVVIDKSPVDYVHSIHQTVVQAEAWRNCKEHDGDSASIATCDLDTLFDFIDKVRPTA